MRALSSVVVLSLLFPTGPALAQGDLATSIAGTWRMVSHMHKEVGSDATSNSYGQKPVGFMTITPGGYAHYFFVADNRKAPASANFTDAERVELFKTMSAGGGTYKVDGKKMTVRYDASWHQMWTGKELSTEVEVSGKVLTLRTAPFKRAADGKDVTVVSTWERVE